MKHSIQFAAFAILASCSGGGSSPAQRDATPDAHVGGPGTWTADDHNYAAGQPTNYFAFGMSQSAGAPADNLAGHVVANGCSECPIDDQYGGDVHGTIDGVAVHLDLTMAGGAIVVAYNGVVVDPAMPNYIRGSLHVVSNDGCCAQMHDTPCDLYYVAPGAPLIAEPRARARAWVQSFDGEPTIVIDARSAR